MEYQISPISLTERVPDYESVDKRSTRLWDTTYGLLSQSVEEIGSNPIKFQFESEVTHQYAALVHSVRTPF